MSRLLFFICMVCLCRLQLMAQRRPRFFRFPHRAFQLPNYFFWNRWQQFQQPGQWKAGLIDSWDRKNQDSPIADLLQTMIVFDSHGRPHKPRGIDPTQKSSVKIAAMDHHRLPNPNPFVHHRRRKRNFLSRARLWEQKTVPYEIQQGVAPSTREKIAEAIKAFQDLTCVRIVPRSQATNLGHNSYVYFVNGQGCSSYVGRQLNGQQPISLQEPGCGQTKVVIHELMHAIGQMHEQQRTDRDEYIEILYENVPSDQRNNFDKENTHDRTPYDVESILQYPLTAFSLSNGRPTMKLKDPRLEALVDTAQTFTLNDLKEITIAYQCAEDCPDSLSCENGGFVAHTCQCMCPADLTGVTCGEVVTDTGCGGVIDLSSGENRTIQSPNYPSTVPVDRECVWLIKGPANSNVRLTIQELDLARNSNDLSCYHWLEIRYNFPGQTGIRQCNTQSANRQITTTNDGDRNIMILKFDSKFSKDVRPSQNQRFSLQVTAVGGTLVSNPCNPNPCQNSGTCSVSGSTYECTCTSGWSGTNCDVEMQSCQPNPCQNGGTCSIVGNSITCNCPQPFTGPNCEDSFISDPCNPNPCQNFGSCRAIGSTYQCTCRTGWSGTNCNIRAQSCQPNTCLNGGTCSVVGTSTRCSCPPSFTGPICENSLISNPCNPNPCQNFGTCRAIGSTYQCTCRVGWSGTNCNISAQSCQPNTCLNGGTCSVVGTSTRCSCPPRFTGPNCEIFTGGWWGRR